MQNKNYKLLCQTKAQINVDCIKICPFDSKLFAFAFYEQSQIFLGGISVKHIQNQIDLKSQFNILKLGPVLHICWLNQIVNDKYILLGAGRTQKIYVIQYDPISTQLKLKKQLKISDHSFCLYIDAYIINQIIQIVVSTNQSDVFYLKLNQNYEQTERKIFKKHQYAVWCCRLNNFKQKQNANNQEFACGDQVNSIYLYHKGNLIQKNNSAHQQGICDIVFKNQWQLYAGGFDGYISHIDTRMFTKIVNRFKLEGTIWRIVPSTSKQELLVCNSSEKKFQVINSITGNEIWNSEKIHTSLAYAADWSENYIVTASFYDKIVCFWNNQEID